MKIYTKKGDGGETALYDGTKLCKSHTIICLNGTVDECNSYLGLSIAALSPNIKDCIPVRDQLFLLQHVLFDLGCLISCGYNQKDLSKTPIQTDFISVTQRIETWIDSYTEKLPKLTQFILPGGSLAASHLHVARSISRKLETLMCEQVFIKDFFPQALKFINRLSDFLFTLARYVNILLKEPEIFWDKAIVDKLNFP